MKLLPTAFFVSCNNPFQQVVRAKSNIYLSSVFKLSTTYMNQIGTKIRKIRELKNIAPKDMADRLKLTPQGYQRIERDEVNVNVDRLLEIAAIFELKPEEVLNFDEKVVFHFPHSTNSVNLNTYHQLLEELKNLYEENMKVLHEKVGLLEEKMELLKSQLVNKEFKNLR